MRGTVVSRMLLAALASGALVAGSGLQAQAVAPALDPGPIVKNTNFIHDGQVKFAGEQVRFEGAGFPASIYNGHLFTDGQVYDSPDCSAPWMFDQILCDPGDNKDNPYRLTRLSPSAGLTFYNAPAGNRAFVVIDLKQVRQFNTLRVFQMFSDGKVTDAAMSTSSTYGDNWPMFDDQSWTEVVPRSPVTAGAESGGIGRCPTVFGFTPAIARYVRLDLWNTAAYGGDTYVEVAGAKLMYEDAAPSTEQSCPPAAPTGVAAKYADGDATVTWTPPTGVVTGQTLQQSTDSGATWKDSTTVPATLDGTAKTADVAVSPGTYLFRVKASNAAGDSEYSTPSNSIKVSNAKKTQKPVKALNLPTSIRPSGWTKLLKLPVRTNAGQRAKVLVKVTPRLAMAAGERQFAIVSRANGKLRVWLSGQPARVRLLISAPATDQYTAYRLKKVWTT